MKVGIIMGSTSDYEVMSGAVDMLSQLGIEFEKRVVSAHRTPDLMYEYAKTARDRDALRQALKDGIIDTVGSDHAPHLESEKLRPYLSAPSGIPSIQHSLPVLLTVAQQEDIPVERIASAFSERPAELFGIKDRGAIKEGYYADIVIVDPECRFTPVRDDLRYKCGWTPYEGAELKGKVDTVFVNGKKAVSKGRLTTEGPAGNKLVFKN